MNLQDRINGLHIPLPKKHEPLPRSVVEKYMPQGKKQKLQTTEYFKKHALACFNGDLDKASLHIDIVDVKDGNVRLQISIIHNGEAAIATMPINNWARAGDYVEILEPHNLFKVSMK